LNSLSVSFGNSNTISRSINLREIKKTYLLFTPQYATTTTSSGNYKHPPDINLLFIKWNEITLEWKYVRAKSKTIDIDL
jgi:hypothetical protein